MPLNIIDHPLAQVLISHLRNKDTQAEAFRKSSLVITHLLMFEATRSLPVQTGRIATPLEETDGTSWVKEITIVPVIRAGISMVGPALDIFPNATVGYVGLERNEDTAIANSYYCKIPNLAGRKTFIVDPMLATGGSTLQAIRMCQKAGADDISVVTIVSAPEGVEDVLKSHPDLSIFTAALDRELNEKKFILPGLGDFGDRLYNT